VNKERVSIEKLLLIKTDSKIGAKSKHFIN